MNLLPNQANAQRDAKRRSPLAKRWSRIGQVIGLFALCVVARAEISGPCTGPAFALAELRGLAAGQWQVPDVERRQRLGEALVGCLGDPDPTTRDALAFEGLSTLFRQKQLTQATQLLVYHTLLPQLAPDWPDTVGFAKPFAALVLAEVARADRVAPFLNIEQRTALLVDATLYLRTITDYRGFVETQGWRHGVAHGADLLMQLALNPALTPAQLGQIVDAVASQVAPPTEHFYIYGEPDRLARPAIFAARRGTQPTQDLVRALTQLANPHPLESWNHAFESQRGLARLHNTKAFFRALLAANGTNAGEDTDPLARAIANGLAQLP